MFTVYSDSRSDSTVVSNLFIDEYMKSANDAQIKVYLYLLRMTGAHRTTSISDMADLFNHTEKDVVRSLRYWEQKGLLDLTFSGEDDLVSIRLCRPGTVRENPEPAGRILSFSAQAGASRAPGQQECGSFQLACGGGALPVRGFSSSDTSCHRGSIDAGIAGGIAEGIRKYSPSSCEGLSPPVEKQFSPEQEAPAQEKTPSDLLALESFRQDAGRARLLFVIEQYIGKPLSLNEIRIIHHISEDLRFSDDLIDYLLQYCVDRGRKDFRYIGGVAENWAKEGILTPAQAESSAAAKDAARADVAAAAERGVSGTADAERLLPDRKKGGSSARARQGRPAGYSRAANSFNQFEQNSYDFDALEDELLGVSASGTGCSAVAPDASQ